MHQVWKYELTEPLNTVFTLLLPQTAQLLDVQMQGNTPCLWVLADPDQGLEPRSFLVVGTGTPITNVIDQHVGTVQQGTYVFHVFTVRG